MQAFMHWIMIKHIKFISGGMNGWTKFVLWKGDFDGKENRMVCRFSMQSNDWIQFNLILFCFKIGTHFK